MNLKGKARLDRRTKDLVQRLRSDEIAIICHDDIDEVAARSLIEIHPRAIINAQPSITGRYSTRGVYKILQAGIPVIDEVGEKIFDLVRDGAVITIDYDQVFLGEQKVAVGKVLSVDDVEEKLLIARENLKVELDRFVENTLEYAKREKDVLLGYIDLPELKTRIENRPVLIVVRGKNYKEDLKTIRGYMQEEKPVLIGVDGGADALVEFGYKPDIIVGDMDSVSDTTLRCGAEIVVHAYADGSAPGLARLSEMGIYARVMAMPGTSEDIAMIIAFEKEASLIVAVGSHSNLIDFLEKGRKGMSSTFLVRLKVGSILVDAKGVSQLYRQGLKTKYILQLILGSLVPVLIILWVAPSTRPFFKLIWLQFKLLFNLQ